MSYLLPDIRTADVSGKTVILTADLDVPLAADCSISDETRLTAGLPTVQYLIDQGAHIVMLGKLGRPEGKVVPELSLEPVAQWFSTQFKVQSEKCKVEEFDGWKIGEHMMLLENIRFFSGEEENDSELSQKIARIGEIYCNDAFAMSHRNQVSTVGIAQLLPHYAGIHLLKEVEVLGGLLNNPKRPMVVVIGGAKIETKLPLIQKMEEIADHVLVGGKIAQEFKNEESNPKITVAQLTEDGSDVTEESVADFLSIVESSATVVWNGPVGIINEKFMDSGHHEESSEKGTRTLAEGIAKSSAYKVIGGGDTVEFVERLGLTSQFDFVSTGGGAMLAFLSGEKLPGLEALSS